MARAAFEAALLTHILATQPDILGLAGFMRVLTPAFVNRFTGRMLNIHPSLLPLYPGLHTHQRALDAGDAQAGCTVHEVTPILDDGPILGQARVPILPGDTPAALVEKATLPDERCITGTLAELPALALRHQVRPPALIMIGSVVSVRAQLLPATTACTAGGAPSLHAAA